MKDTIDIVFSFDTTGSMYPCLTQVRNVVSETVMTLFDEIPDLRIGVIAHGDYCDGIDMIKVLPLTRNIKDIIHFVKYVPPTNGGDVDELYELVLNTARRFNWTSGRNKALVLIGDANPHKPGYHYDNFKVTNDLNWRNEARLLKEAGIQIYPVQALGRYGVKFYDSLSTISGNPKIELPQFSDVVDILLAVTYQRAGQLEQFSQKIKKRAKKPSYHVMQTLDLLAGKPLSKRSVKIGSRFQVLDVPSDCSIRKFVEDNGLEFKKGRGFYQFTKSELIQEYKEVVAQNNETGAIISGKRARQVLGIPEGRVQVSPKKDASHSGFVQSTSVNRKLKAGTKFLYEITETEGIK